MGKFIAVYITAKDEKEAEKLGSILVKERLAGCINIIPNIRSSYWWKGKIENMPEALLIAKTKEELFQQLLASVKKNHSYSVPCVNALPILDGNPDYLKWLENETK
jgi:periplasmic divalent cation tolerance protein